MNSERIKKEKEELYVKRTDYMVGVEISPPGEEVWNFLEKTFYTTSEDRDVILTGTKEEQWLVNKDKLLATYNLNEKNIEDLMDGKKVDVSPRVNDTPISIEVASEPIEIKGSQGDIMQAKKGDIIAYSLDESGKKDLNAKWVIDREVFERTYYPLTEHLIKKNAGLLPKDNEISEKIKNKFLAYKPLVEEIEYTQERWQ